MTTYCFAGAPSVAVERALRLSAQHRSPTLRFLAVAIACLAIALSAPAIGAEFQPVEAGTTPLRERLAEIRSEALSVRNSFTTAGHTDFERLAIAKRLVALEAEEKRLTAELESAAKQAESPYITYAAPPSTTK